MLGRTSVQGIARIRIRAKRSLKDRTTELFDRLGLDMGTAVNMFLVQSVREEALPFRMPLSPLERDIAQAEAFTVYRAGDAGAMKRILDNVGVRVRRQVQKERRGVLRIIVLWLQGHHKCDHIVLPLGECYGMNTRVQGRNNNDLKDEAVRLLDSMGDRSDGRREHAAQADRQHP
ncbi:addiction module antitoxin, RelB/DinJ family [Bifidobacterium bohemicum]|uniref:Putative toxin-antitoxin system protein n=1 Tax=Bifidobacterium bohemicum DSM 22767 TaxID=1437606 RepID=A0A086ZE61_9BIFI|nr:type II toxin-antitoxin system RelB/DinJ family antitoxin [Bifidobacterium bohemicum]KFI44811.1 putative toxin-antitoxin system protein [Bifidobacterium bohemicum DSM 22767]SCB94437.1 addiction module antitoxin, RelB/DinJ family [Bifidobacterium bohemicum]